ncbi:hypothetical protein EPUL_004998 [Erysiphe pulchra]|uniref:Uncharacterized protein n=1 Tax=Erysiphe pulchra TaxID=225359 RepID=A0A2S4PM16_9PEZI|nr:hypothetical protein EPUL_004998 [Erysiphe pulchra]
MVGKTSLEPESIVNNVVSSQRKKEARLNDLEKCAITSEKRSNGRFEIIENELDEVEKNSSLQSKVDKDNGKEKEKEEEEPFQFQKTAPSTNSFQIDPTK